MFKYVKLGIVFSLLLSLVGCSADRNVSVEDILEVTELPVISITTENNEPINKVEKENSNAIFEIMNTNGMGEDFKVEIDENGNYPMTIKGRGNSSWTMPTGKKPYNIKFEEKQDLLGLGEGKKWSLIASWTDTSFIRNFIAYKLAKELDPNTPDCEMVELCINGNYEGIYLLCEAYQIKENRVVTIGDGQDINGDGEITQFLVEADCRALQYDEPNRFLTPSNYWMVVKEPDEDEIVSETDERFIYVSDYFKQVDQAIVNLDNYEAYIDVDSLVTMYVVNEYLKNADFGFGNQPYYASTFMYMEEGGKLCFGPMWDSDLAMGRNDYREIELEGYRDSFTPEGRLAGNTHWISQLLEDPIFVSKVETRWQELKPYVKQMIDEIAPAMIEKIALTQKIDFSVWDETSETRTTEWSYRTPLPFEEEAQYVLDFMEKRLTWMDNEFGK